MAKKTFKASVGSKRLSKSDTSSLAKFTKSTRNSLKDVTNQLSKLFSSFDDLTPEILAAALTPTFDKIINATPEDTGALLDTLELEVKKSGNVSKATISAGGPEAPYAPFVHERLDLNHQSPTRAKFIQGPLEEDVDAIKRRIKAEIRKRFKL